MLPVLVLLSNNGVIEVRAAKGFGDPLRVESMIWMFCT